MLNLQFGTLLKLVSSRDDEECRRFVGKLLFVYEVNESGTKVIVVYQGSEELGGLGEEYGIKSRFLQDRTYFKILGFPAGGVFGCFQCQIDIGIYFTTWFLEDGTGRIRLLHDKIRKRLGDHIIAPGSRKPSGIICQACANRYVVMAHRYERPVVQATRI